MSIVAGSLNNVADILNGVTDVSDDMCCLMYACVSVSGGSVGIA